MHATIEVKWVTRFKSAQGKNVRDLKAVKSACPAYAESYIFPTTYKSILLRALISSSHGALLNRDTRVFLHLCFLNNSGRALR